MAQSLLKIVENFHDRRPNPRHGGSVEWGGSDRIFCWHDRIFSYGTHFTLARYLGDTPIPGHQDENGNNPPKPFFIKNADTYSSQTTGHQALVRHYRGPAVSFSGLNNAGVDVRSMNAENVLDYTNAAGGMPWVILRDGVYYEYNNPKEAFLTPNVGMFVPMHNYTKKMRSNGEIGAKDRAGYWHIAETALIFWKDALYLCGVDEGTYFVSKLPESAVGSVKTVAAAFESLKPAVVVSAELSGRPVIRQGEWFFVQAGSDADVQDYLRFATKSAFAKAQSKKFGLVHPQRDVIAPVTPYGSNEDALPVLDENDRFTYNLTRGTTNQHVADRAIQFTRTAHGTVEMIFPADYICPAMTSALTETLVSGRVFHRTVFWGARLTGEHQTLSLDGWWRAIPNTEQASWTSGGNVD